MACVRKVALARRVTNTETANPGNSTAVVSSRIRRARARVSITNARCQRRKNVGANNLPNYFAVAMEHAAPLVLVLYATPRHSGIDTIILMSFCSIIIKCFFYIYF
jgi:hypothetical protein